MIAAYRMKQSCEIAKKRILLNFQNYWFLIHIHSYIIRKQILRNIMMTKVDYE